MDELRMPLVDLLIEEYEGLDFSKVKIIGVQHILETTHSMIRSLYKLNLKPDNVSLIGKCYSTCRQVYEEMISDGIDVSLESFTYSSHVSFDEQFEKAIEEFLLSRMDSFSSNLYDKIIVLDDGGKCIKFFNRLNINSLPSIVAIEQTSSGYEAIRLQKLLFPVINVARSPTKLRIESPMIAKAAAEKLYNSLKLKKIFPENALIIGAGAIGKALFDQFSSEMKLTICDKNRDISDFNILDLSNRLSKFKMVIGCTGSTSIPYNMHSKLFSQAILVSVSSSDREFDAVYLRRHVLENFNCHEDLEVNDRLLINSGFPVNFDGDRENISSDLIQITLALITGGILKGRNFSSSIIPFILPLGDFFEKKIEKAFIDLNTSQTTLFS